MPVINFKTDPVYRITGRSLVRQLRNGTPAEQDRLIGDVLSGKAKLVDPTKRQLEYLVAGSRVGMPKKPLDEKARLARKAARTIATCGYDVVWTEMEKVTEPELPLRQMAAE